MATALVVVGVSAGALALFWSRRAVRLEHPAPAPSPAPVQAVPPPPAPPEPPPDPRPRFTAARATVACGPASGEAVFVAPDRVLAAVECPDGHAQVRLGDGRELLARSREGAPPGAAFLDVPGAEAPFLEPGASAALEDGEPLLVGLEGGGAGTVAEATSRGLVPVDGRALLAVSDAAAPIAGPVVDQRGALVGIVPSSPPDPERPWLAIPVEAFATSLGRAVSPAWSAAIERAGDEERRAVAALWNALARSAVLLEARVDATGNLSLVVGRVSAGRPPSEVVRLHVEPPAPACDLFGRVVGWRTGARALEGVAVGRRLRARLERLPAPPSGAKLWVGTGSGRPACDEADVPPDARLAVLGSEPPAPVRYPLGATSGAAGESAPAGARPPVRVPVAPLPPPGATGPDPEAAARAETAARDAEWELGWRQAFRDANDRVARSARRRMELQAQRDEARGNFQYVLEQQLDDQVEAAKLEERLAAEALEELDRRASLDAVPRAWRRP